MPSRLSSMANRTISNDPPAHGPRFLPTKPDTIRIAPFCTLSGSTFVFRTVRNRDWLPGLARSTEAQRNGLMAVRKTNAIHALNAFTVEEYEGNGKTGKRWTKIGTAFPHKEGIGFSIELKAIPLDGRLVALPPDGNDDRK
jgi:hypothetical protein